MMAIHAYTSFSYSYLSRARVWARSLKQQHHDWIIWAVITDKEPQHFNFDLSKEPFDKMISAEDLFGKETESWLFGHDIVEACTAVKGRALQHIMAQKSVEKVIYFDPDTAVFNTIAPIIKILDEYSIVLTPHQIDPEPIEERTTIIDNEIGSLKWGVFNLGFVAVANDAEGIRFANWWADRLNDWCHDQVDAGIFVDQKWCNLVPCFFDKVKIIRDPGYNVASWNLSQRKITVDMHGNLLVNGQLLRFFHFTKLGPIGDTMTARYAKANIEVYEVWSAYRRWIERENEPRIPNGYWFYGYFGNGAKITKSLRESYRQRPDLRTAFQFPFSEWQELYTWALTQDLV